ncbi:hypothetical protein [Fibrivirga algicola]|nr:hypothetical protein [Fibrivirga algicola]
MHPAPDRVPARGTLPEVHRLVGTVHRVMPPLRYLEFIGDHPTIKQV